MSSSFDAVKAAVKADLESETPDTGFHDQWIRSKIRALETIKSEADLASPEEITRNIGKFDSRMAVSQMIREALSKGSY